MALRIASSSVSATSTSRITGSSAGRAPSRAARYRPSWRSRLSTVSSGPMNQVSAAVAERTTASSLIAAIQIGGRGRCTERRARLAPSSR